MVSNSHFLLMVWDLVYPTQLNKYNLLKITGSLLTATSPRPLGISVSHFKFYARISRHLFFVRVSVFDLLVHLFPLVFLHVLKLYDIIANISLISLRTFDL